MKDLGRLHPAVLVDNQTLEMKRWNLQELALEEDILHRSLRLGIRDLHLGFWRYMIYVSKNQGAPNSIEF